MATPARSKMLTDPIAEGESGFSLRAATGFYPSVVPTEVALRRTPSEAGYFLGRVRSAIERVLRGESGLLQAAVERALAVESRLANITAIDLDWGAEGAEPPNAISYENARRILEVADVLDIEPSYVTASAEGGIGIVFKKDRLYSDIECFNSGEIWAVVSALESLAESWQINDNRVDIGNSLLKIRAVLDA